MLNGISTLLAYSGSKLSTESTQNMEAFVPGPPGKEEQTTVITLVKHEKQPYRRTGGTNRKNKDTDYVNSQTL